MSTTWAKLSPMNVNKHTEKKGSFTYLSWAWAWKTVKDEFPNANFELHEDIVYPDKTMEVRVSVTIERTTHTAFLPVLNHQNKPIVNPNAFDVNTARMRCLVKAIAFHGLGLYLYAGEDLPPEKRIEETKEMIKAGIDLNKCLENDDLHGAAQIYDEWSHEENAVICRAPSNGGQLTTQNRAKLKETAFRMALNQVRGITEAA